METDTYTVTIEMADPELPDGRSSKGENWTRDKEAAHIKLLIKDALMAEYGSPVVKDITIK